MNNFQKHLQILDEGSDETKAAAELIELKLRYLLVGKKIKTWGPGSESLWATSEQQAKVKTFEVTDVVIGYLSDNGKHASVDVVLKDYNSLLMGRIYTCRNFIKNFRAIVKTAGIKPDSFAYSEQGMQGENSVNLDLDVDQSVLDFVSKAQK